jgi:DNA-binding CsgD family transcriptional regulator
MTLVVGREAEQAALRELLGTLGGRALVRAAPGMGKTVLVESVLDAARAVGLRLLHARPLQVEASLAFSGLHDLLRDTDAAAYDVLPAPQRSALRRALLLDEGEGDLDPRAVNAAVTTLLEGWAAEGPLLLIVDDGQWLDAATAAALHRALVRTAPTDLRVLGAARSTEPMPAWLPDPVERGLEPLGAAALFHVVRNGTGRTLDHGQLRELERASRGNPLHALEFARHQVADGTTLDALLDARVRSLPRPTRLALLVAALAARPRTDVVARARRLSPTETLDVLEPAVADGLVHVGADVAFAHPLHLAAVVDASAEADVREARLRLAEVDDLPGARIRHRALAAEAPDPALADALHEAAVEARRRGAWDDAVDLMRLALRHDAPAADGGPARRRRALPLLLYRVGRPGEAAELLEDLIDSDDEALASWSRMMLGHILVGQGDPRARALYDEVVAAPASPEIEAEAHLRTGYWLVGADRLTLVRRARDLLDAVAPSAGRTRLLGLAMTLEAFALVGLGEDPRPLARAAAALEAEAPPRRVRDSARLVLAEEEIMRDRLAEASSMLVDLVAESELRGDDSSTPALLLDLALVHRLAGDWTAAEEALDRAETSARGQGQSWALLCAADRAWLDGVRGDAGAADRYRDLMRQPGSDQFMATLWQDRGNLLFMAGDEAGALDALRRAHELAGRTSSHGTVGHDIEFLQLCADLVHLELLAGATSRDVRDHLAEVQERAESLERPMILAWTRVLAVLAQAGDGDLAGAADAAVAELPAVAAITLPLERARMRLALGRVLRRARRKRAAHDVLGASHDEFLRLDAPVFAAAARAELARVGLRPAAPDSLTDSEQRVAELAALGLRNQEIAGRVYASTKTVEATLGRCYRKLGVRSRTELAAALAERAVAAPPD